MCVIRVGGEENDFLEIAIAGYTYPGAGDYWDGNWLRVDVKVAALDDHWSGLRLVWRVERRAAGRPGRR